MDILFAHERAAFTGGVEQNIADSVHGLSARGVRCHLAFNPQMPQQQRFLGLFASTHACNELSSAPSILPTPTLAKIAANTAADCIYVHKIPTLPRSLAGSSVRTVQMVHDHDLYCPRRHKYFALNAKVCSRPMGMHCYLEGAFLARDRSARLGVTYESIRAKQRELTRRYEVDLALVASEFMRHELMINGFKADRVQVLPLAIRDAVESTSALPSGIPTILFVGQLIRGKGVDLLLRALATIKVPFQAMIVGQGNAAAGLRKLGRDLGLDYRVEFVGWVNNEDLPRYYSLADILAVPSRWPEPFGMVGLEAMRHSKPVVAFDVGGISDWLTHERTGLLVPAGDVTAYAAALQRLLIDRRESAQMGANAAVEVKQRFAFERYIDGLVLALSPDRRVETELEDLRIAS